ncbi:ABC transporter ATP-binding protein [Zafaria sp. Z1313]|uniref:ABC transporter ATP-binding protein n=1 Tax=unclassified Zafaria TaxID=2828765 RepID=UPI002E7A401F|nr:ABC transporter ATP-binding protein [Zafaria sp. J156]MEE1620527.1 ABC transporter ATP-binding protein [Zafaria sp. J156]
MGPGRGQPTGSAQPVIVCEDVVRIFSGDGFEVQALQGLNLRVEEGEMTAIIGASGSGKSTLLTILSGLDLPTAGTARVAGVDLLTLRGAERVRYRRETVGFVWQQTPRNLLPYLSARENVMLPMSIGRRREARERAGYLLETVGLGDLGARLPSELSGGQQQRVALAVSIANNPRVVLADEPTGELDERTSAEVLEAMRAVNEELGTTTLIVTHDPTVSEHVRRTIQIRDGRCSTETLRRTHTTEAGHEHQIAEEFAVIDKVGRLQLPEEFMDALDMRERVRLGLQDDHVQVSPGHAPPPAAASATGNSESPTAEDPPGDAAPDPGPDPGRAGSGGGAPASSSPDQEGTPAGDSDAAYRRPRGAQRYTGREEQS